MDANEVAAALAEPFDVRAVKWKPQAVQGNRCLAVAYVNARTVMRRLDGVLGVAGWQDEYQQVGETGVFCRLTVLIGGVWITKSDAGGVSEQPDDGDKLKAAVSDALKRAAVKFGIGRYLYSLPLSWVGYDPVKRQIIDPPKLPAWALPRPMVVKNAPANSEPRAREAPPAA